MTAHSQQKHTAASAKASPPPYEGAASGSKHQQSTPDCETQRQPGPAMSGHWYQEDAQPETIKFVFCSDPSRKLQNQEWKAMLFVKCSDVPLLMREGFYWSSDNVVSEDGYMRRNKDAQSNNGRESGVRYYFLRDLQQPQRWTAMIEVFATEYKRLCRFDLSELSQEKMYCALAMSQLGDHIYQYCAGQPQYCYNAIYNDTPLEGQWPWPKMDVKGKGRRRAATVTKEERQGGKSGRLEVEGSKRRWSFFGK
ncbi:hypothetical protein F4861DRAFT_402774 [Xylaria intraflava]|nr:hypothetical protein F4861DRAFT_402774 [Xylaria intraflava]